MVTPVLRIKVREDNKANSKGGWEGAILGAEGGDLHLLEGMKSHTMKKMASYLGHLLQQRPRYGFLPCHLPANNETVIDGTEGRQSEWLLEIRGAGITLNKQHNLQEKISWGTTETPEMRTEVRLSRGGSKHQNRLSGQHCWKTGAKNKVCTPMVKVIELL